MRFNQKPWPWCKLSWYFFNGRSVMLMHNWESLRFHEYNELARENSNQIRLSRIDNSYHFKTISIFLRTLCNYAISPLKIWNSLLWKPWRPLQSSWEITWIFRSIQLSLTRWPCEYTSHLWHTLVVIFTISFI